MAKAKQNQPTAQPSFNSTLSALVPLILEEWPQLDRAALEATKGDREALVSAVSAGTDHTRTLVRRHLNELDGLAAGAPPSSSFQMPEIEAMIKKLEAQTKKLVDQVQTDVLPAVEEKARDNVGKSMLTALGLGFILGLLFGGFGRGR